MVGVVLLFLLSFDGCRINARLPAMYLISSRMGIDERVVVAVDDDDGEEYK